MEREKGKEGEREANAILLPFALSPTLLSINP